MTRSTHTEAVLPVSRRAYDEIAEKLEAAGYGHLFIGEGNRLSMTGIALVPEPRDITEPPHRDQPK